MNKAEINIADCMNEKLFQNMKYTSQTSQLVKNEESGI